MPFTLRSEGGFNLFCKNWISFETTKEPSRFNLDVLTFRYWQAVWMRPYFPVTSPTDQAQHLLPFWTQLGVGGMGQREARLLELWQTPVNHKTSKLAFKHESDLGWPGSGLQTGDGWESRDHSHPVTVSKNSVSRTNHLSPCSRCCPCTDPPPALGWRRGGSWRRSCQGQKGWLPPGTPRPRCRSLCGVSSAAGSDAFVIFLILSTNKGWKNNTGK